MKLSSITRPFSRRRRSAVLALDLGMTAVKAVHVRRDGASFVLDGFRVVRLHDGPSPQTLEAACREALHLRLGNESIAVSITSPGAAIRKVELPPMTADELLEALPWEARRQISGLPEDAIVDAQVLNAGQDGTPMDVLLVAFPRHDYAQVENLLSELGAEPEFIDLRQLATMNSLRLRAPSPGRGLTAVLDLGSGTGFFSIFAESSVLLYRDLSARAAHLNSLLASHLSLDGEQIEILKLSGKLPDGKVPAPGMVEEALLDLMTELNEDVRSGLVYLENHTGSSLEHVYLTGGNAIFLDRQGVLERLSAETGITLQRFNPFSGFRFGMIDEIGFKAVYSELCAPAGLAVRFFAEA